jgi:hypothetical protein
MENIVFDFVKRVVDRKNNVIGYQMSIDGVDYSVPIDSGNRHYIEIQKQIAAGTLTVLPADE